jgi:hypothetical protein
MKTSDWLVLVGLIIGGGGTSGLVGSLLAPLIRRPAVRAEATARITGAAARTRRPAAGGSHRRAQGRPGGGC